ncbi:MAG: hypothetical protein MUE46_12570 [Xanthomonadales bacterium]|nr:hypothetical protein [Xanthomonadales bacterium]
MSDWKDDAPIYRQVQERVLAMILDGELKPGEKRRGLGLYVREGAREQLLAQERERFLQEEWPALKRRIERLGLSVRDLMTAEDNRERHH